MGCISSKRAVSVAASPDFNYSLALGDNGSVILEPSLKNSARLGQLEEKKEESEDHNRELGKSLKGSSNGRCSLSFRLGNLHKYVEAEQVAAGWPAWLSAVASEAIQGWVPLRSDSFEKLEKIGQGTYSSVFRARDIETGKIVALKKVHLDSFQPETIRFMAREIMILRRLDHPNIMKLEGLITSRLSCSIYLVFEYMEHDLAGLLSCPDIQFSDSQIKCYMQQLLYAIEHCHLRGIMHRDIKASNILVNNEGILKLADFGLANSLGSRHRQPLTSRVITLWYRPPELLLGSTNYVVSVDLWSVGCVFAELLIGKPILKGRTEVEQLHKIFKLCGSPPEEYWKKSKLPHATMFKPQHPYESSLRERFKEFPRTAVNLLETFLSIEPHKRGTASSALMSEYFTTMPRACDPSSLPKYSPNKEIDAKSREEARRKKAGIRTQWSGPSRKPRRVHKTLQEPNSFSKLAPKEEVQSTTQFSHRNNGINAHIPKGKGGAARRALLKSTFDTVSDVSQVTTASQGDIPFSGPLQVTASSGFAWAKRRKEDAASSRSYSRSSLRSQAFSGLGPSVLHAKNTPDLKRQESEDILHGLRTDSRGRDSYKVARRAMQKQRTQFDRPDSFDTSDVYHSQELSMALYDRERIDYKDQRERIDFSGSLLSQSHGLDELLQRHESHIRQAVRSSRLQRGDD